MINIKNNIKVGFVDEVDPINRLKKVVVKKTIFLFDPVHNENIKLEKFKVFNTVLYKVYTSL